MDGKLSHYYFRFKSDSDSSMHLKFNSTGIRTHDLWIMISTLYAPETLVLTAESSGTSFLDLFHP